MTPPLVRFAILGPMLVIGLTSAVTAADHLRAEPVLACGADWDQDLGELESGRRYELLVSIAEPAEDERIVVELLDPAGLLIRKVLHAGDPDVYIACRARRDGRAKLHLSRSDVPGIPTGTKVEVSWRGFDVRDADRPALEAEPNDDPSEANLLVLGRSVYGSADDVDYVDGGEGKSGPDWFRFDVSAEEPILVTFTLDLTDRDVSADLGVFTLEGGRPVPYATGKDPMEMVHDRERVRFSKNLVRTFARGRYYLRVDANHPAYVLRTRVSTVPPFDDPARAVEAGLHYILNAGDAWLAQVPREGNRFNRATNLHETSLRCTGCHATSFPAEAALAARRSGYAVHARAGLDYMLERIADAPAPLYGDAGLFWQRYIATPLEVQGAQGGILADYEGEGVGAESSALQRFSPFLKAAWEGRTSLPEDEQNVVPSESKFGLAWRDWKVLSEIARRTGREDYARVAANIAAVTTDRAADRRVETLQDRVHRLVAWSLMDRTGMANKMRREIGALLAIQNADGGWHESDVRPGPSCVYVTGQMVDALLEAGLTPDHPSIAKSLRYLLAQQQDFGGWFQEGTHENFRTPMRETRYAVMALARAFPHSAPADVSPHPPRTGSLVETLDDLEALWDAPRGDRDPLAATVIPLLEHASPLVRASAASALGRLEQSKGVEPLALALDDPSKVVRRAAAFALRRLGNRGVGVDAIARALGNPASRIRRSATELLTRQVPGMDSHEDLTLRLIDRADDSDLATRFEAARALRRWFYRTPNEGLRKRIVAAMLSRMTVEEVPLLRKNLSENLYIIMDENLGGAVSLQRNLAGLPESARAPILEARRGLERDVLLGPVLTALHDGNSRQREGILRAFDGSFLKGRNYARRPTNAVDVGNDRDFGFLYEPPIELLDRVFEPILASPPDESSRRHALQLASFFGLPAATRNGTIRAALLAALEAPDPETRRTALRIVREEMNFDGAARDPILVRWIAGLIGRSPEARSALLAAIGKDPDLAGEPEIAAATSVLAGSHDEIPDLQPNLDLVNLPDDEMYAAILRAWKVYDPARKTEALGLVLGRLDLRGNASPGVLAELFRKAAADPSEAVRTQAYAALIDRLSRTTAEASSSIMQALADEAPAVRRLGLAATSRRASFWDRGDALERLARLLIDPDAAVRSDALDVVKHHRLAARFPAVARRVKALAAEPALASRVDALLRASGFDPSAVAADVVADRPILLSLDTFRRTINPLFSRPGLDGHACVDCHASHSILRLAEPREGGPSEEDVALNFASASGVVDLARPENSLLLRKPLSPSSDDVPHSTSPGNITHDGGRRWADADDPAYRAILSWIREAAAQSHSPVNVKEAAP